MTHGVEEVNLYASLLGSSWERLPEMIHWAHSTGVKRGRFDVRHGSSRATGMLVKKSRLPPPGSDVKTTLVVGIQSPGVQRWERFFGNQLLTTTQWVEGSLLVERFGRWELLFCVSPVDGGLSYRQVGARYCLGTKRLRIPLSCAPQIAAQEFANTPSGIQVTVTVKLPMIGLLITYDGTLQREEDSR